MTPEQKEKWETIRAKGFAHFLLVNGVIRHPAILVGSAILGNLIYRLLFTYSKEGVWNQPVFWLLYVVMALAGGIIMACVLWSKQERRYAEAEGTERRLD